MQTEAIERLSKDLKKSASTMSTDEARYLVDTYYIMQGDRIRAEGQMRALTESGEPHGVIGWLSDNSRVLENQIKRALDSYSASLPLGAWAREVVGIGPVIAAGLLAHIDLERAPTAGHIWRFAGLDPTSTWGKGEKRPWNQSLKVLCWKIGESFVKVSGNPEAFYGHIYAARKAQEQANNDAGLYADQAASALEKKKYGKATDAFAHYSAGRLPPAHLHARAKRYAVKLFLAHYHETGRKLLGYDVPLPYPIAHLGHAHKIEPHTAYIKD